MMSSPMWNIITAQNQINGLRALGGLSDSVKGRKNTGEFFHPLTLPAPRSHVNLVLTQYGEPFRS